MAGLWDRIIPGEDRIGVHAAKASIYLVARGVFTATQVRDKINERLTVPLSTEAEADLMEVVTNINALGTIQAKLDYLERFDALNIAAEGGFLTNEGTWRSELGL